MADTPESPSNPSNPSSALERFSGVAPIFPLPSLVVLPDSVAPLLIFEPRYRQMIADVLEGDGLLATATIDPTWTGSIEGDPPILPHVCLGCVVGSERLADGRYRIVLFGLVRAAVVEEVPHRPYRKARLRLLKDAFDLDRVDDLDARLHAVLDRLPGRRGQVGRLHQLAASLRENTGGPGRLADAAAEVADLEPGDRYRILSEADVVSRLDALIEALDRRVARSGKGLPARIDPRRN